MLGGAKPDPRCRASGGASVSQWGERGRGVGVWGCGVCVCGVVVCVCGGGSLEFRRRAPVPFDF